MYQALVVGIFIELCALCLPVGNESLSEVGIDDVDLLEFRVGRVVNFVESHFQTQSGCLFFPKDKASLLG